LRRGRAQTSRSRAHPDSRGSPAAACGVDTRLVALARSHAPLRRALAAIAGRLVFIRAWERLGFARLRDYAVERAGLSARQVQDLARMDAAFAELPRCEAAFFAGSLSWTKARLIARVATPEDEAHWLAAAQRMTAGALAREVRGVDGLAAGLGAATDEEGALEERRETVFLRCAPGVRAKLSRARLLVKRVTGESLPTWACMEAVAAEVLSAIPLDGPAAGGMPPLRISDPAAEAPWPSARRGLARDRPTQRNTPPNRSTRSARVESVPLEGPADSGGAFRGALEPADFHGGFRGALELADSRDASGGAPELAFPPFLRELVRGLDGADAFDLDARLRRAMKLAQAFEAQLAPLLLEIASSRRYRALGFPNMDDYVRERLGMSPRKAQALLRLERAGAVCPDLRAAFRAGALSWVQAQALIPVFHVDGGARWHTAWVGHARRVSVRRLEAEVERALVAAAEVGAAALDPGVCAAPGAGIGADVGTGAGTETNAGAPGADPQTGAQPTPPERTTRFFFTGPRDVARLFRAVLATVQRRIERREGRTASESEALRAMLDHFLTVWGQPNVPKAHAVFERDGWRCTVPGCSSYRNLHDHHIRFRSAGGSDALANRTTLCAWHHLRGVHAGTVRCAGTAPRALHFALGVRANQPPLATYGPGEVADFVDEAAVGTPDRMTS
jgi:hypothetical protein